MCTICTIKVNLIKFSHEMQIKIGFSKIKIKNENNENNAINCMSGPKCGHTVF